MTTLKVIVSPDPVLRKIARPVENINDRIRRALDDMAETMYASDGIGLSANQVGLLDRLLIVDLGEEHSKLLKIVNPEIIFASDEKIPDTEGCLSFPDEYYEVKRSKEIIVRYLDENGRENEIKAQGLLSACFQHEIDHLNGVLMIDRISRLRREAMLRKLKKQSR